MRLEDYPTEPRYAATVRSSEAITEDKSEVEVRELVLEIADHEFDFEIGQSVGVLVEGNGDFGRSVHHRLYTVADIPTSEGNPEITIVVRRCNYIDDYSGEEYVGVNSNYSLRQETGGPGHDYRSPSACRSKCRTTRVQTCC